MRIVVRGPTQMERLEIVERDVRDHAKSLSAIFDHQSTTEGRLRLLEEAHSLRLIADARAEERSINRDAQLKRIEDDVQGLKGGVFKLIWLVAGAVVLAFVAFVVKGGLSL